MTKISSAVINQIIEDSHTGMDFIQLIEKYKISRRSMYNIAKKYSLVNKRKCKITKQEIEGRPEFFILCCLLKPENRGFSCKHRKLAIDLLTKLSLEFTISVRRIYIESDVIIRNYINVHNQVIKMANVIKWKIV